MKVVFFYSYLFLHAINFLGQNASRELKLDWQFSETDSNKWHKASVPGNIYSDLFNNALIVDPYLADHESNLQWIAQRNWEYYCSINCNSDELISSQEIELECEGLDTYAKVYLNGELILTADNMFRCWKAMIKNKLKVGKNTLLVKFQSATKRGKELASLWPYKLPEGERVFTRKAQFQYGWDFSPRYMGCGIWKAIHLNFIKRIQVEPIIYHAISLTDSLAELAIVFRTTCFSPGVYQFAVEKNPRFNFKGSKWLATKDVRLSKGFHFDTLFLRIKNPKRWWCNGLGLPHLYKFIGSVTFEGKIEDEKFFNVGLRTIELLQNKDEQGQSFYFKLNGIPVYAKGANFVPTDVFLNPNPNHSETSIVLDAKAAGMNMLRVWGGGVYGSDQFYTNCDQNGILVWQDFMFAGAMYPLDSAFISNTKIEVKEQVLRLRNHPALALWCGNNEIKEAWFNWGWQKEYKYSNRDSVKIWTDYLKLFEQVIPTVLFENQSSVNYHPSSPSIGWGHKESLSQGDLHYWGVWWGLEPFSEYAKKVGRFCSEFGFQSLPDFQSIQQFCSKEALYKFSPSLNAHQKHKTGYATISTYMSKEYKLPKDLKEFAYVSQLVQRDGMKTAIEAQRSSKPRCMGSLFWQWNDCWPAVSWSAKDYFGRPKVLYHQLKQSYAQFMISAERINSLIQIILVSDSTNEVNGNLIFELKNFNGDLLWQKEIQAKMNYLTNSKYSFSVKDLPNIDSTEVYLNIYFKAADHIMANNRLFFTNAKYLSLSKANIVISRVDAETLLISSDVFARDIYLYSDDPKIQFSDNGFDLERGQQKMIKLSRPIEPFGNSIVNYLVLNNL